MEWWQTKSVMQQGEVGPDDPTFGDYGRAAKAGIQDVGAAAGAGLRSMTEGSESAPGIATEAVGRWLQDAMSDYSEQNIEGMSPVAQERINAAIDSPEFWDDIISTVGLQGTRMSGSVAASVLPSLLTKGAFASTLAAGAGTGALSAAYVVDDLYAATDALSDEELLEQSPFYRELRESGEPEEESRIALNKEMRGLKPLLMFGVGGAMGMAGPAGQIARTIAGGTATGAKGGLARRVGRSAAAGAGSEFVEETSQAGAVQHGEMAVGLRDEADPYGAAVQGATAAVLGGVFGAGAGGVSGRGRQETPAPPPPPAPGTAPAAPPRRTRQPEPAVNVVPEGTPSPAEAVAIDASKPEAPAPQAAPEPPQPAPQAAPEPAQPAPQKAPAPAQPAPQAAPAPATQPTQQVPPAVEGAAQRVEQATRPVTPEVTPAAPVQPQPTSVPEPVAEASQRIAKPTKGDAIKEKKGAKPKAAPKVEQAPDKPEAPKVEEPKAADGPPRILPDQTTKAEAIKTKANIVKMDKEEKKRTKGVQEGHRTKAEKEARKLDEEGAKALLAKHVSDEPAVPTKDADIDSVVQRVQAILADAKAAGIKAPGRVREKAPDHLMWLREVEDMAKAFAGGKRPSLERVQEYAVRERAAKAGEFGFIRESRKVAGDEKSRGYQGDVETKADTSKSDESSEGEADTESTEDTAASEERVDPNEDTSYRSETQDAPAKPGASANRDRESEGAASTVRKVKVSDEDKARYLALSEKMKTNEVPAEAKPAPRDAAKPTTKGEAVKAKSQDKTKPKTPAQRVAAAAKETNKNPTEAEKKAGNYKKGKATFEGFEFKIETPKGARRTGTAPDGTEWSVKMPVHYGYIKGTKGADGDAVDVFFGPDLESDFVMVIDQVDPDTQAFDEHKVMFGFKGIVDAQQAYQDSFSDGRADERAGDFRVMTVEEFKAWVESRGATEKPAGEPEMVTSEGKPWAEMTEAEQADFNAAASDREFEAVREQEPGLTREEFEDRRRGGMELFKGIFVTKAGGDTDYSTQVSNSVAEFQLNSMVERELGMDEAIAAKVKKVATTRGPLSMFLDRGKKDLTGLDAVGLLGEGTRNPKLAASLFPKLMDRISAVAGDTEVYVLPDLEYNDDSAGLYIPSQNMILLPERTAGNMDYAFRVILHEGVHAAFMNATWSSPEIQDQLHKVLAAAKKAIPFDQYGLTNIDELLAEGLSNTTFQDLLASIPAPKELVSDLKLDARIRNMWDIFVAMARKALGLPSAHSTLLHAVMRISSRIEAGAADAQGPMSRDALKALFADRTGIRVQSRITDKFFNPPPMQEQVSAPWLLKIRSFDQIALVAKDFFGKNNPVRKISDLTEQMRVTGDKIFRSAEPIVGRLHDLERKYDSVVVRHENGRPVTMWQEFTSLVHDETMTGAFADRPLDQQPHLGKDALKGKWAKAKHADLAARYQRLPADLRAARAESMAFFTKQQNDMSLGIIKNRILKALGVEDDALARRIHEDTTTPEDAELLDPHVLELILEAKELAKIKGPYFPLMRRGDFVVRGKYRVTPPGNALRQIDDNTWEFDSRDKAIAWAERQDTRPSIRSMWLDETTGEPWVTDSDGTEVRIHKNDANAVQRFRVSVQDRHVEFFDSADKARAAAHELGKSRAFVEVPGVEPRKFEPGDRQVDMLSSQLQSLIQGLERREGYRGLTDMQKNELVQTLNQASIRFLGATRIQSRRLQRTYVEGASHDLTQNTLEYAQSSSGYLARLQHQPALDEAMKELDSAVGDETRAYGKGGSLARGAIANEVRERVHASTGFVEQSKYSAWVQRLMTASFIDKLVGPSYSMINATQPMMITFPELAGRYGPGVAFRELSRAYADIGAGKTLKKGLQHTITKARDPNAAPLSLLEEVKSRVSAAEARMLTYLSERGSIDADAGLELDRLVKSRQGGAAGRVDQALGYMEGIGRQLPIAVETINRTTSALAAYRLEMARSKDHDTAVAYAQEAVNRTQFLYSNTNAPPVFSHPVARVALQFKKFGQGMYHFLGYNVGKALRNANEGDRSEAVKTLAYLTGAHMAIAGMMGLPTEPIKMLLIGAKAAGMGFGWEDVERWQREALADFAGEEWGEVMARGLPRMIGIDLSSRVGLESLVSFGEPREYSESEVWAWTAKTAAGAPPGLVADWFKGAHQLSQGEFVKAAELMVPLKIASDSIRAYRQATEGKKSAAGNETMEPYTAGETAARVLGFTPAREAESFERSSAFYAKSREITDQRTEFMREWETAAPSDRSKLWSRIVQYNRSQPRDVRITRSELNSYLKRRRTEASKGTVYKGMRTNARTRHVLDDVQGTYNIQ